MVDVLYDSQRATALPLVVTKGQGSNLFGRNRKEVLDLQEAQSEERKFLLCVRPVCHKKPFQTVMKGHCYE